MSKLVCPDCRSENEIERVYCHDCGAKLDRSRLKKEGKVAEEKPEEVQKRVRRMLGGRPDRFKQTFFKLAKVLLAACAAAALVLLFSPPPEVPEKKKISELPPQINLNLEDATIAHHGAQLRYTEQQVNAYLAGALRSKQAALDNPLLHFERVLVKMDEGNCQITQRGSSRFQPPTVKSSPRTAAAASGACKFIRKL